MPNPPTVLIVGTGAIGSLYGAVLHRAGCQVQVVVRSDYEAIAAHGIAIESPLGDLSFHPTQVHDGRVPLPPTTPPPDYVLLCSKVSRNLDRAALLRPHVGPHTSILLIQNGINIEKPVADAFPEHPLLSAVAFVGVSRTGPGRVHHQAYGDLVLGRYPNGLDQASQTLAHYFQRGGITVHLTETIVTERWRKCLWNSAFNPLSALTGGADTRRLLDAPGGEALVRSLAEETRCVAVAAGHPLPPDTIDSHIALTRAMPPYKTSMALDYLAGRPLELDAVLGDIVTEAARHNVPVPHLQTVLAALHILLASPTASAGPPNRTTPTDANKPET